METLSTDQIEAGLADLDGWEAADQAIVKRFTFDTFMDAIAFINQVAAKADAANHHPQIVNSYTSVELTLTTHSAGGVTSKDLDLATEVENLRT